MQIEVNERQHHLPKSRNIQLLNDKCCKFCFKVPGEASLAALLLLQGYLRSAQSSLSDACKQSALCKAMKEAQSLGLGGRMVSTAVSSWSNFFSKEREGDRSLLGNCREDTEDILCEDKKDKNHIQCGRCGHDLAKPEDIFNVDTPHALSSAR